MCGRHQARSTFDLYHSIHRVNKRLATDEVPCILPSSQMFLVNGLAESGRLLVPPELLGLLGWDLSRAAALPIRGSGGGRTTKQDVHGDGFTWAELSKLAGNAFSGFSFMAVSAAVLMLLSNTKKC